MSKNHKPVQLEELLLAEVGAMRLQAILLDDEPQPPGTVQEFEAESVMNGVQCVIETLLAKGVDLGIIETGLFYWFLSFAAWNRNVPDTRLSEWTTQMDQIAERLIAALNQLCSEIDDGGPSHFMRVLGYKIDQLKLLLNEQQVLSQAETELHTEMTMRCLEVFYEDCCKKSYDGLLIETSLFYHWLRTSTIRAVIAEEFFQKVERNWADAVRGKDRVLNLLARTA